MPETMTRVNPQDAETRRLGRSKRLHVIAARLLSRPEQYSRGRRAAYVAILYAFPTVSESTVRQADRALRRGAS